MRTITNMDSASDALPDLDGLSLADLKALLIAKDEQLTAKDQQLATKDAELLAHRLTIESLKLLIPKLQAAQ